MSTTKQSEDDDADFDAELARLNIPELAIRPAATSQLDAQFPTEAAAAAKEPMPVTSKTDRQRLSEQLLDDSKTAVASDSSGQIGERRKALREKAAKFKRDVTGAPSKRNGNNPLGAFGIDGLQESLLELSEAASADERGESIPADKAAALMAKTQSMLGTLMAGMNPKQRQSWKKSAPNAQDMIAQLMAAPANALAASGRPKRRPTSSAASALDDTPVPNLVPNDTVASAAKPASTESKPTVEPKPTAETPVVLSKSKKRREKLKQKRGPNHPSHPD